MKSLGRIAPALVAAVMVASGPARGQEAAFVVSGQSIASNRSVQQELKATKELAWALEALAALVNDRFLAGLSEPGEEPDRFRAMVGRANAELHAALGQVLGLGQVARFDQLAIWVAGLEAFDVPRVRAALRLTATQAADLANLEAQLEDAVGWSRTNGAEMGRRLVGEFKARLTPAQGAAWKKLAGEPFDLVEDPIVLPPG